MVAKALLLGNVHYLSTTSANLDGGQKNPPRRSSHATTITNTNTTTVSFNTADGQRAPLNSSHHLPLPQFPSLTKGSLPSHFDQLLPPNPLDIAKLPFSPPSYPSFPPPLLHTSLLSYLSRGGMLFLLLFLRLFIQTSLPTIFGPNFSSLSVLSFWGLHSHFSF